MKNIYKKIARKIFMHAYYNELCEIGSDIKKSKLEKSLGKLENTLGKLEVLEKLDLLL